MVYYSYQEFAYPNKQYNLSLIIMNKFSFACSPAWTIAQRFPGKKGKDGESVSGVPGPGTYQLSKKNRNNNGCKIGTGNRGKSEYSDAPGPGAYEIGTQSKSNLKPGATFGGRNNGKGSDQYRYPGPGSYSPDQDAIQRKSQGCTLGSKYNDDHNSLKYVPGPGQYDVPTELGAKLRGQIKIGTSTRDDLKGQANPGPGTYQEASSRPFSAGPKYGFSKSIRNQKYADNTPGPGKYNYQTFLSGNGSKGVTLLGKKDSTASFGGATTPGPGHYTSHYSVAKPHGGKIGNSAQRGDGAQSRNQTPGPGQYDSGFKWKESQSVKIGTGNRGHYSSYQQMPGPGAYDLNRAMGGTKITISGHKYSKATDSVPGPGTYEPNMKSVLGRPSSAKIGSSIRTHGKAESNPGPGHYNYVDQSKKYKFAYTKQLRSKESKVGGPGPGSYEMPSSIPNLPSYVVESETSRAKNFD